LRSKVFTALLFPLEVEDFFVVLVRDGVWEREDEKRFTTPFVFVFDLFADPDLFMEDEGSLLVTAERLGIVRFTVKVEDLNLDGTVPFPCVAEFMDVTDFCELGEYLLMYREEIPDFEMLPPVLLARLEDLLITPELLRLELDVRIDVAFTRERELLGFPEEYPLFTWRKFVLESTLEAVEYFALVLSTMVLRFGCLEESEIFPI